MARYDNVKDETARALLAQAQQEMRSQNPAAAVRTSGDAFIRLIELKPDLLKRNLPADDLIHHRQFPRFGAVLVEKDGKPEVVLERERFSMSEAITYWEYTLDTALHEGL